MKHYDVAIVGSGGGSKITRPAANLGKKVAIIEEAELGGTCLNRGCIPSKMLIHAADVAKGIVSSHKYFIHHSGDFQVDFQGLVQWVSKTIEEESQSIAPLYEAHPNIDLIRGRGRFVEGKVLQVGEEKITADKIFLAVGAKESIPPIPGLEGTPYMTYRSALRCETQPKRLIVIGGGFIAVELGHFFGALGTDVTFLVRRQILRFEDSDIQSEFEKAFSKHHHVFCLADVQQVEYDGEFRVRYCDCDGKERVAEADALLVATGVQPDTADLGLENTGVQRNDRGYIEVDDCLETHEKGVFAFGDCIGRFLFRHSANFEGEYLFQNQFVNKTAQAIQYPPMPHAVFSNPQVGSVGPTEEDLKQSGQDYFVGFCAYKNSAMGMALRSEEGFVKLLFARADQRLLAAHVIGEEASDMVHMLVAYIQMNACLSDLLNTIYIHPALPEIVRNAARNARQKLIEEEKGE